MSDLASQATDRADDTAEAVESTPQNVDAPESETDSNSTDRLVPGAKTIASGEARTDDLLGELARAMHQAATSQYERMNAELETRRVEQVEAIAMRAASEVERLKSRSETDVDSIEAWARAETEKIGQERTRRMAARREQLSTELGRQDTIREREVSAVDSAIKSYRTDIDRFFGRMEREHDPAAIAKVAATMPTLPPLAQIANDARRVATAEFAEQEASAEIVAPAADTPVQDTEQPVAELTEEEVEPVVPPSEARLMGVMDPDSTRSDAAPSREWAQPAAVSVAAGSPESEAHEEVQPRVGSTLLRTVRAIRPMSDHKDRER
jgi:hypothetical protein